MDQQNEQSSKQGSTTLKFLEFFGVKKLIQNNFLFRPPQQSYQFIRKNNELIMTMNDKEFTPFQIDPEIKAKCFILHNPSMTYIIPCVYFTKNSKQNIINKDEQEDQQFQPKGRVLIIYSHGNSSDLGSVFRFGQNLSLIFQVDFIAYDYSGYGISEGRIQPDEKKVYNDLQQVFHYAISKLNYNINEIILLGFSLGTAVSVEIATRYSDIGGLILMAPLSSFNRRLTNDFISEFPDDQFDTRNKISFLKCPIIIFHGEKDLIIPISHSLHLKQILEQDQERYNFVYVEVPECGHNDLIRTIMQEETLYIYIYELIVDIKIEQVQIEQKKETITMKQMEQTSLPENIEHQLHYNQNSLNIKREKSMSKDNDFDFSCC